MYRALVISSSLTEAEEFHTLLSAGKYPDVAFRYPAGLSREKVSLSTLYTQCCDVIKEESIDVIISAHPEYSLIHAALAEKFPELTGPKMDGVFLCLHRYYNKEMVLQGFNACHRGYEVEEVLHSAALATDLEELGFPVILKDSYHLTHTLEKKVYTSKQFCKDIHLTKLNLQKSIQYLKSFLQGRISAVKYPLAFEPTCVVEEHMTHNRNVLTLHYVEACVADEVLVPWIISDISHFQQKPKYNITFVCVPTRLDDSTQYQIWAMFREVAQSLISAGLNNQFFHAKIAVYRSGIIKFLDLIPCPRKANLTMYAHVFQDGDNIRGQIDLGLGRSPWKPRQMPGRCAIQARVSTPLKEGKMADLVDIKLAKSLSEVKVLHAENDIDNDGYSTEGVPLLDIQVTSSCYDEGHGKVKTICSKVLTHIPNSRERSSNPKAMPQTTNQTGSPTNPVDIHKESSPEVTVRSPDMNNELSRIEPSGSSGDESGSEGISALGHSSVESDTDVSTNKTEVTEIIHGNNTHLEGMSLSENMSIKDSEGSSSDMVDNYDETRDTMSMISSEVASVKEGSSTGSDVGESRASQLHLPTAPASRKPISPRSPSNGNDVTDVQTSRSSSGKSRRASQEIEKREVRRSSVRSVLSEAKEL